MSIRPDISDYLIHFTKGDTYQEAFNNLYDIIRHRAIRGNNNLIKGSFNVVCITEAPMMKDGLVNPYNYSKYSPFGIMFSKHWIFSQGGRPVIYQSDEEYEKLSNDIKWRHVRYEPHIEDPVDFTWEREWRLECDLLDINPENTSIIVPNNKWAIHLKDSFDNEVDMIVRQYSIVDELLAEMFREEFDWQVFELNQEQEER